MKKTISVLLVVVMLFSALPLSGFASPESDPVPAPAPAEAAPSDADLWIACVNESFAAGPTPEDVHAAIDAAAEAETELGETAPSVSGVKPEAEKAVEALEAADEKLSQAEQTAADIDKEIDTTKASQAAREAQNQDKAAEQAAVLSEKQLMEASVALNEVIQARSEEEALAQADKAAAAADQADVQAVAAVLAAEEAAKAAEQARQEYEAALAACDRVQEEIQRELEEGLISAEEAEARAKAAYDEAESFRAAMQDRDEAKAAAIVLAQENVDKANADLQTAIDELERASVDSAEDIARKSAVAAATDVALGAAKLAAGAAQLTVNFYQSQIETLEQQIAALNEEIANSKAAIAAAQAELDALDAEDAEYPRAVAALEAAKAAQAEAEKTAENAEAILALKRAAEASGEAQIMAELQDAVRRGVASEEDKRRLTEYVLAHVGEYDENASFGAVEWIEGEDGVFRVTDAEGVTSLYTMKTVEELDESGEVTNRYLQYFRTEYKTENAIEEIPDAESVFPAGGRGTVATSFTARNELGEEFPVYIKRTQVLIYNLYDYQIVLNGKNVNLTKDDEGNYYYRDGDRHVVSFVEKIDPIYVSETNPIRTASDSISTFWRIAEEPEVVIGELREKVNEAQENYNMAKEAYDAAQTELSAVIEENQAIIDKDSAELTDLNARLDDLQKRTYGNRFEQVFNRAAEDEETLDLVMKFVSGSGSTLDLLRLAAKLNISVTDLAVILSEMTEISEQLDHIMAAVEALNDGEINRDDITAITDLVVNANLSSNTKLTLANLAVRTVDDIHTRAVEALQEAMDGVGPMIEAKTRAVSDARAVAQDAQDALELARTSDSAAIALAEEADRQAEMATAAWHEAQQARALYEELFHTYGPESERVQAVKQWAQQADQAADDAEAEAERAKNCAITARENANLARTLAEAYYDRPIVYNPVGAVAAKQTIAEYALSLQGDVYSSLIGADPEKLSSRAFVEFVYDHFGYSVDLSSNDIEELSKNGRTVDILELQQDDLMILLAENGSVAGFAICFDNDSYVWFNENSGVVELSSGSSGLVVLRIAEEQEAEA